MERMTTMEVHRSEMRRLITKDSGYAQIKAVCADPVLDDATKIQCIRDIIKTHDELMDDCSV